MSIIAAELIAANISKVAFVARAVPRPAAANAFVNGVGRRRQIPDAIRVRQRIRMIGPTDSVAQITLCGGREYWPCIASRSEEHTSELQSLMRISYAVFCLKKKK